MDLGFRVVSLGFRVYGHVGHIEKMENQMAKKIQQGMETLGYLFGGEFRAI